MPPLARQDPLPAPPAHGIVTGYNVGDRRAAAWRYGVLAGLRKYLAQESTSGCRFSSARRSRSVMPPQTPNSIWLSSASAAHSAMTGQCRQMAAAFLCAAPRTNSRSGSVARHRALDTHAMRASAVEVVFAVEIMGAPPRQYCVPQVARSLRVAGCQSQQKSRRTYAIGNGTAVRFSECLQWQVVDLGNLRLNR